LLTTLRTGIVFNVERRTTAILRVHIPLLSRTHNFTTTLHTFYQRNSPRFGHRQAGGMEGKRVWRAFDMGKRGLLHVHTARTVMGVPYYFLGILVFHLRYT